MLIFTAVYDCNLALCNKKRLPIVKITETADWFMEITGNYIRSETGNDFHMKFVSDSLSQIRPTLPSESSVRQE